jgi:hypothetical protein
LPKSSRTVATTQGDDHTTVSAGNINDDSIRDVIASALIQEYAKRQDARGG